MNRQKHIFAFSLTMLFIVIASVGVVLFGLSRTMGELSVEMSRSDADVILASANIGDRTSVSVPVLYYSQAADPCINLYDLELHKQVEARQFEWQECGYYNTAQEKDIVEPLLGEDLLPVAIGGDLLPNRGIKNGFKRWFSNVSGLSNVRASSITLKYSAADASFIYSSEDFYPLNSADGAGGLFTMNLAVPIHVLADGAEEFNITADDDTWVFVGDRLALDLGGLHGAIEARFKITEDGEVYTAEGAEELAYSGIRLKKDAGTVIRIFHANRNSSESIFKVAFKDMLLNIEDTELASIYGTTIAYDPNSPDYIPPLGESLTVRPDKGRAYLAAAVTEVAILGVLMVMFVITMSLVQRHSLKQDK